MAFGHESLLRRSGALLTWIWARLLPESAERPSPIRTVPSAPEFHRVLPTRLLPSPNSPGSRAIPPVGNWDRAGRYPHPAPKALLWVVCPRGHL